MAGLSIKSPIKNNILNGQAPEFFNSPSYGKKTLEQIVGDLINFVSEDEKSHYAITVGTDSEQFNGLADYVSVVVIHRIGKHGRYFWKAIKNVRTFDRHDRILKEAYYSLDIAERLVGQLRECLDGKLFDFEIHLDIGKNGETRDMIQEIVGIVVGNGFKARIKPESYAANKVADRHVG